MNSKTTRHSHLSLWYTTAAVATVGGGLACPANEAAANIISYSPGLTAADSGILDNTTQGVWFDLKTGQTSQDQKLNPLTGPNVFRLQWLQSVKHSFLYQFTAGNTMGLLTSFFFYPFELIQGAPIGGSVQIGSKFGGPGRANPVNANSSAMSLVGAFRSAQWKNGDTGYLGLRFASGGKFNYGWAEVSIAANDGQPKLVAFGYETKFDTSIPAGATQPVPEPNPLLLLVTGAAGLGAYRAWRARRDQRRVPEPVTA